MSWLKIVNCLKVNGAVIVLLVEPSQTEIIRERIQVERICVYIDMAHLIERRLASKYLNE